LFVLGGQPEQSIGNDCLDFENRKRAGYRITDDHQNLKNATDITHPIQTIIGGPISNMNVHIQIKKNRVKFVANRKDIPRRVLIFQYLNLHIFFLTSLT